MAGSFVLDSDLSHVSGTDVLIDIGAASETLPAWWMYFVSGNCRQSSLSVAAQNGTACPDLFGLQAGMNIVSFQAGPQGPNTARIRCVNTVQTSLAVDLVAGQEYGAFKLTFNNNKTVGTGSCAGCDVPMCIELVSIKLYQEGGSTLTLTEGAFGLESKFLSWQVNGSPLPFPGPLCAALDSAGFGVNTSVLGRGEVLRSRTKVRYPPGSPLTLVAAPLPGDRFVAWAGDTTSTEDTLNIVVNRELNYFVTFERDPAAAPALASVVDVPSDQGGHVLATWSRSPIDDAASLGALCCYRLERTLSSAPAAPWVAASGSIPANFASTYSRDATTSADSVQGDPALLRFRVVAIAAGATGEWTSNEVFGYSVDNIAPPALASVSGVMASGVATMFWPNAGPPDLSHYAIYRGLAPAPPADAAHLVGTTTSTNFTDSPGYFANYVVTAVDRHGNQSQGTPFVALNAVAVNDRGAPRSITVGKPSPSPMRRSMSLSLGLPRAMNATVEVLDSQGRLVRRISDGDRPAGWATVSWDARDARGSDSSPGIYFVRVQTPDGTQTRRLALIP